MNTQTFSLSNGSDNIINFIKDLSNKIYKECKDKLDDLELSLEQCEVGIAACYSTINMALEEINALSPVPVQPSGTDDPEVSRRNTGGFHYPTDAEIAECISQVVQGIEQGIKNDIDRLIKEATINTCKVTIAGANYTINQLQSKRSDIKKQIVEYDNKKVYCSSFTTELEEIIYFSNNIDEMKNKISSLKSNLIFLYNWNINSDEEWVDLEIVG